MTSLGATMASPRMAMPGMATCTHCLMSRKMVCACGKFWQLGTRLLPDKGRRVDAQDVNPEISVKEHRLEHLEEHGRVGVVRIPL
jgi:hypothetical protein